MRDPDDVPPFRPTRWLPGGDLQTIVPSYLPPRPAIVTDRTFAVPVAGGDELVIQENDPTGGNDTGENDPHERSGGESVENAPADRARSGGERVGDDAPPLALIIHGLGGCHSSPYVVRLAARLAARGWRTFRVDLRGFGASAATSRSVTHAGRGDDVARCVAAILARHGAGPLAIVGHSLGGNLTLRYLADVGAEGPGRLVTAVAVSPPIDLTVCSANIGRLRNRIYDTAFVRRLWRFVQARRREDPTLFADLDLRRPRTLRQFDEMLTAPVSGYPGASEYYADAASGPHLERIAVPTTILTAADDPLIPPRVFQTHRRSAAVRLVMTRRGGHVGWLARPGVDPDRWWLDWRVVGWLTSAIERWRAGEQVHLTEATAADAVGDTA